MGRSLIIVSLIRGERERDEMTKIVNTDMQKLQSSILLLSTIVFCKQFNINAKSVVEYYYYYYYYYYYFVISRYNVDQFH